MEKSTKKQNTDKLVNNDSSRLTVCSMLLKEGSGYKEVQERLQLANRSSKELWFDAGPFHLQIEK